MDSRRVWAAVVALAVFATVAAAPVAADSDVLGLVSRTYGFGLRVRAQAGPGNSVLAVAPEGAQLTVTGDPMTIDGREWRQVTYGGISGWVASRYLDLMTPISGPAATAADTGQATPAPSAAEATLPATPVAAASDTPSATVAAAESGDRADTSSRDGRQDGGVASAVVDKALSLVGHPYRMGGSGPNSFDCAGLVHYVFSQQGITLPRDAASQWSQGTEVDRSDLRPGDLVFFKNTYIWGISHVGIYVGNGQFVHAVDEWSGVAVTAMDEGYWPRHYVGARRIAP